MMRPITISAVVAVGVVILYNRLVALRQICLALPGAEEKVSHGRPTFRAGKIFAVFGGSALTACGAALAHVWDAGTLAKAKAELSGLKAAHSAELIVLLAKDAVRASHPQNAG